MRIPIWRKGTGGVSASKPRTFYIISVHKATGRWSIELIFRIYVASVEGKQGEYVLVVQRTDKLTFSSSMMTDAQTILNIIRKATAVDYVPDTQETMTVSAVAGFVILILALAWKGLKGGKR